MKVGTRITAATSALVAVTLGVYAFADLRSAAADRRSEVVEQARGDGHVVHLQVDEDPRHLQGVDEVGLPREPLLALVDLGREHVGPPQNLEIGVGEPGA